MAIYLFSGSEVFRQEQALTNLLEKEKITKENRFFFDASDAKNFSLQEALLECDRFSLFDDALDKKAVIIKEPYFLNPSSKTKDSDKEKNARISLLEQYLLQPNPNVLLVFYCHNFDADKRKKEYKLLEKHGAIIEVFIPLKPWEFEDYMRKEVPKLGYTLTKDALQELIDRCAGNSLYFHNAIEKMNLYGKKELNLEDIIHIVPIDPEVNVFQLSNAFIQGNTAQMIQAKEQMKSNKYDEIAMMALLAGRIRSLYQIKKLYELGYDQRRIAQQLNMKEYAIKIGLQNTSGIDSKTLLYYLNCLAQLDQDIKMGKVDPVEGFDLFILGKSYASNQRII